MNWGHGITILTISFICFMTFLVVGAFRQNVDLVTENYYQKELEFQDRIDRKKNQQKLKGTIQCIQKDDEIQLQFPSEISPDSIQGALVLFCPSDAAKDVLLPVTVTNGMQRINKKQLSKGMYRLQLEYSSMGTNYYYEKDLMIY